MSMRRIIMSVALFAAISPLAAELSAQNVFRRTTAHPRGWLGITFTQQVRSTNNDVAFTVVITDVADDSPAKKAGVVVGDTIVRVNDFRASSDLIGSLGSSIEPGDSVRFVVKRGGNERKLTIIVGERPANETFTFSGNNARIFTIDPDSVRGRVHLFVDSIFAGIDTSRVNGFFRLDSTVTGSFSVDSIRGFRRLLADSMFFHRMPGEVFEYRMQLDSLRGDRFRALSRDSMVDHLFRFASPDFEMTVTPGDRMLTTSGYLFTARAFGGAGLAELNEGLAEYFKADRGVLVLTVPKGTPAERAGLEPGDVVTEVNGTVVSSIGQLREAAAKAGAREPIRMTVVRHGDQKKLELRRD